MSEDPQTIISLIQKIDEFIKGNDFAVGIASHFPDDFSLGDLLGFEYSDNIITKWEIPHYHSMEASKLGFFSGLIIQNGSLAIDFLFRDVLFAFGYLK